jgi:chitin disaccharide deacetylase
MPETPAVSERVLVVNADDFGRSPGVNRGVIKAHTDGIVTSATLMVRWPAAEEAAAYARRSSLSLGFHLDLGDWQYRDGQSHALYEVLEEESPEAVANEIERQLERFERVTGRSPTHLDSHQHVHLAEPVRSALLRAGERLGVAVRDLTPGIAYSGEFYGQYGWKGIPYPEGITVEALVRAIENLPPGITELGCHPASPIDHETSYGREREQEVATLCDPRVRAAIDRCGVALRSFGELSIGNRPSLTRP